MKLNHAHGATQDGRVMVERSDRMWSTGEGNGKPLQYSCLENPMNSMKRQNDRILKEELPSSVGAQYATGDQWRNNSRKNEGMESKTEDEMAGWHHWLDGRESQWTPEVGDGQGGLACCDAWGCKESDPTEQLNWTELNVFFLLLQTENQPARQYVWMHYKKTRGFAPGVLTVNFCPDTDSFTSICMLKQGDKQFLS